MFVGGDTDWIFRIRGSEAKRKEAFDLVTLNHAGRPGVRIWEGVGSFILRANRGHVDDFYFGVFPRAEVEARTDGELARQCEGICLPASIGNGGILAVVFELDARTCLYLKTFQTSPDECWMSICPYYGPPGYHPGASESYPRSVEEETFRGEHRRRNR